MERERGEEGGMLPQPRLHRKGRREKREKKGKGKRKAKGKRREGRGWERKKRRKRVGEKGKGEEEEGRRVKGRGGEAQEWPGDTGGCNRGLGVRREPPWRRGKVRSRELRGAVEEGRRGP